jgi:hypothetical protein
VPPVPTSIPSQYNSIEKEGSEQCSILNSQFSSDRMGIGN